MEPGLGRRLREAISDCGLTIAQAAGRCGISQDDLEAALDGQRRLTQAELVSLADVARVFAGILPTVPARGEPR